MHRAVGVKEHRAIGFAGDEPAEAELVNRVALQTREFDRVDHAFRKWHGLRIAGGAGPGSIARGRRAILEHRITVSAGPFRVPVYGHCLRRCALPGEINRDRQGRRRERR